MTTMTAELRSKIERRARRAWKRRREGAAESVTRVSDVTETSLKYRLPYTPDYYGSERIDVILKPDGSLEIDPKTTGLIDVLTNDDIKRLKKHGDRVKAYYVIKDAGLKIGDVVDSKPAADLTSRHAAVDKVKGGERVLVVELLADQIENYGYSNNFSASKFSVTGELDPQKDLGFTTGLIDCLTKADVEGLRKKKHSGKVRAYKYTDANAESPIQTPKIKYVPGQDYEIKDADTGESSNCHKGINVADAEWCKRYNNQRIFAFEFDVSDIAAIPTNTDGKFRLHRCRCVEELDPKTFQPIVPVPANPPPPPPPPPADEPEQKKSIFDRLFGT